MDTINILLDIIPDNIKERHHLLRYYVDRGKNLVQHWKREILSSDWETIQAGMVPLCTIYYLTMFGIL